jgi:hypothetical protein
MDGNDHRENLAGNENRTGLGFAIGACAPLLLFAAQLALATAPAPSDCMSAASPCLSPAAELRIGDAIVLLFSTVTTLVLVHFARKNAQVAIESAPGTQASLTASMALRIARLAVGALVLAWAWFLFLHRYF